MTPSAITSSNRLKANVPDFSLKIIALSPSVQIVIGKQTDVLQAIFG
jgi:hypothetical protein